MLLSFRHLRAAQSTQLRYYNQISKSGDAAVQIILIGAFDLRCDDLADLQRAAAGEVDRAIDLRRIGL
jgi:hypothetical protein